MELVVGLEHAWRVAEDDLRVIGIDDSHDAVARGLRLEGGNGNAVAHQEVHERGLSHVGIAHDIDESRFMVLHRQYYLPS